MKKILFMMMGCLFISFTAFAGANISTLQLGVNTDYSPNMRTVGQALFYVLAVTDYKLAVGYPASTSAFSILDKPIPPEAIDHGVMPVYQAILLLIGSDARLVIDSSHRLITVETFVKGGKGR